MLSEENKRLCWDVLAKYGTMNQRRMIIEECSELQKAVCKLFREPDNNEHYRNYIEELVDVIVMAQEMLQVINLTTGVFEGIDKAKAGNGNDSPSNAIGNALNQNRTNKITVPGEASGSGENISIEVGEKTTAKTAMEFRLLLQSHLLIYSQ